MFTILKTFQFKDFIRSEKIGFKIVSNPAQAANL